MADAPRPAPTHREIARLSGVARSTVSLALRGDPKVAPETVRLVKAAAAKLGYRPNPGVAVWMAHVQRSRSSTFREAIAYVHTVPPDHSYRRYVPFARYLDGARARAEELGYVLREFEWHAKGMTGKRLRSILGAQGVRGIVIEYSHFWDAHQLTIDFDISDFVAVSLGTRLRGFRIHHVATNYFEGAVLAYARLRELGYHRIGFAIHEFTDQTQDRKLSGGVLSAQSLPDSGTRIPLHVFDVYQGWDRAGFKRWLETWRPDVVMSPNIEVLQFLRELPLRVPEEIGFVDLEHSRVSASSGLDHHPERLGAVAVELLSSRLQMNESGPVDLVRNELVDPTWMVGTTVQPQRRSAGEPAATEPPLRVYSKNRDWTTPGQTVTS